VQVCQACLHYLLERAIQTRASIAAVRKQAKLPGKRNANIKHAVDGGNSVCLE
jgi:hypothetical protein